MEIVDGRRADPELSPSSLARELGVSVRTAGPGADGQAAGA